MFKYVQKICKRNVQTRTDIISKRYHPDAWNIYSFHCSDGDNWPEDNNRAINLSLRLKEICQMYCFIQITPGDDQMSFFTKGGMSEVYSTISDARFKIVKLVTADDIWREFKRIFGGKVDV